MIIIINNQQHIYLLKGVMSSMAVEITDVLHSNLIHMLNHDSYVFPKYHWRDYRNRNGTK